MTGSFTLRVSLIVLSALLSVAFLYAVRWSDLQAHRTPGRTTLVGSASLVFGVWAPATGRARVGCVSAVAALPSPMLPVRAAGSCPRSKTKSGVFWKTTKSRVSISLTHN